VLVVAVGPGIVAVGVVTSGVATAGRLGDDEEGTGEDGTGGVEHPVTSRIAAVNPTHKSQVLRMSSR
jgi:hypothetical protein